MKLLSLFYSSQNHLNAHHVVITISELLRNFPEELDHSQATSLLHLAVSSDWQLSTETGNFLIWVSQVNQEHKSSAVVDIQLKHRSVKQLASLGLQPSLLNPNRFQMASPLILLLPSHSHSPLSILSFCTTSHRPACQLSGHIINRANARERTTTWISNGLPLAQKKNRWKRIKYEHRSSTTTHAHLSPFTLIGSNGKQVRQ